MHFVLDPTQVTLVSQFRLSFELLSGGGMAGGVLKGGLGTTTLWCGSATGRDNDANSEPADIRGDDVVGGVCGVSCGGECRGQHH